MSGDAHFGKFGTVDELLAHEKAQAEQQLRWSKGELPSADLPPLGQNFAARSRDERLAVMVAEDANEYAVDSLDDMQPVPRAGKFFAELIVRDDMKLDSGVIVPGADRELEEVNAEPKRARVLQLGPPRDEPWDMEVGWECIVPFHAGHHFTWINQRGAEESLWILDTQEVIAVFRPRSQPIVGNHLCQTHLVTVQRGFSAGQVIEQCEDRSCAFHK